MSQDANPLEKKSKTSYESNQTVEFRGPDGSADIYLLLAGMAVAARHGLQMKDSLNIAKRLYVDVNIFHDEYKHIQCKLPQLPTSCWESAERLLKDRAIYEKDGVFSPILIDGLANILKGYDDKDLNEKHQGNEGQIRNLSDVYLHCA
jgi:glutamine synthetase